jgi:hypothetical protein
MAAAAAATAATAGRSRRAGAGCVSASPTRAVSRPEKQSSDPESLSARTSSLYAMTVRLSLDVSTHVTKSSIGLRARSAGAGADGAGPTL